MHDILLVDHRGTGESAPQQCNFAPPARLDPPCVYQAFGVRPLTVGISARSRSLCHYVQAPSLRNVTYFESAGGENAALTARLRSLSAEILMGRIDRAQLTPALSKGYSDAVLRQSASQASGKGAMESFVYRGAHRSKKSMAYGYLAHFVQANANVTITLNSAVKVADMYISLI